MTHFSIGEMYSRNDVYEKMKVPKEKQGGIWNTGYTKYKDDFYLFVNIESPGTTGHNYNNKFIGDDLEWYSKNTHSLKSPTIQCMLNPKGNIYIFTRESSKQLEFIYRGIGKVKMYTDSKPVKILWEFIDEKTVSPLKLPEEVEKLGNGSKNSVAEILINGYERNQIIRRECIEYHGTECSVCTFDFEKVYGEIGIGFIHIHQIKDFDTLNNQYNPDPIHDFRPICPNCHTMIHEKRPPYSISELRDIVEFNRKD